MQQSGPFSARMRCGSARLALLLFILIFDANLPWPACYPQASQAP
jgi:hypothetical protein